MKIRQGRNPLILLAIVPVALVSSQLAAAAEPSWVSDRVKVHLRSGAGSEYRITGTVSHPQEMEVLGQENGWTNVRLQGGGRTGWIRSAYLTDTPPAVTRLGSLEEEAIRLRESREQAVNETERLGEENRGLLAADERQRLQIMALTSERDQLRALLRWREWITGASILVVGMLAGAILARTSSRRRSSRLRI